ncbi:MAG: HK97 family phage prohead protease [Geminicoccaceae bacterium]
MLRTVRPFELKFASDSKPGSFSGYGAAFHNIDDGGDVIVKGAFHDTLVDWKARGKMPKMLWHHGLGMSSEDLLPIGYWTALEEDDHGLKVEGQLIALDTDRGRTLHEGMMAGAIDAMSITYSVIESAFGKRDGESFRAITKLDLFEVGPVLWGMNDQAGIEAAKASRPIRTIREFESFLRDAGGFSIAAAKAIASGGFKANPTPRDEGGMAKELAALRERAAGVFTTP